MDVPVHADDTDGIVANRAYCPRGVGAVAVLILRIRVVVAKVVPVIVIDKPIVIIIDTIVWYLACVRPRVGGKIFVRVIKPRIDIRDNDVRTASRQVPRGRGLYLDHAVKV